MERVVTVEARFWFAEGAEVSFGDTVLLSLDCCVCRRCWRTVIFDNGEAEGKCTPTSHPFPGRIVAKEVKQTGPAATVLYRVEYRYEPFVDAKYPMRQPTGEPTWARVTFDLICPSCGRIKQHSVQTNTVRPYTNHCDCGCILYTEHEEMPVISAEARAAD